MHAPLPPCATYRLQFSRDFTFLDAERLVPYLHALGVSHIYASPYLKARAGSSHGYDITDYNALNPEIGSEADFDAMVAALARRGMGQILDIVPNHMGIGQADNLRWLDVLEWGQASPYADFFDIGWRPPKAHLRGKVLLPFLGDHYGDTLETGKLVPSFDERDGSFSVCYHAYRFPLAPHTYATVLAAAAGDSSKTLAALTVAFRKLKPKKVPSRAHAEMRARAGALKRELARLAANDLELRAAIDRALESLRGAKRDPSSFVPLHRLLEQQHYRLAYWRTAADEINYRRFFDINELAGLRIEKADVFENVHLLVLHLFAEGKIDGVRIDHIDGLLDPLQYCKRLQTRLADEPGGNARPCYVVVEKILARHESLRRDWPVAGTTGYDALNLINGIFVDGRAERAIDRVYRRFIGRHLDFDTVIYECRKHVINTAFASELEMLAIDLDRISESSWNTRDFTLASLKAAIQEVAACFPVYRTYIAKRGPSVEDRRDIDWAVALARKRNKSRETALFDFIHGALTTDIMRERTLSGRAISNFAMKFQQFTGPIAAKGLEDTAFYRYTRLLSLNEVGGDPRQFGTTNMAFHHINEERAKLWPHTMVTTATHDTKRGEDVRARINVLTEFPAEWGRRLRQWSALNRRAKSEVDGVPAPSPDDEYLLYQTLVGAWPIELLGPDEPAAFPLAQFRERIDAYMIKAVREAKRISSWATPNTQYEAALSNFVCRILDWDPSCTFLADLQAFATRIALPGMINSLAQTVLKLTIPGIPDIYQGCEFWDLNLVDPDNRCPVDFKRRSAALDSGPRPAATRAAVAAMLEHWHDGNIKLYVTAALLAERHRRPLLFNDGVYTALKVTGERADNAIGFTRTKNEAAIAVAVPRLVARLGAKDGRMPVGDAWTDSAVVCPPMLAGRRWTDVFTGGVVVLHGEGRDHVWKARDLFADLPIAVLIASDPTLSVAIPLAEP